MNKTTNEDLRPYRKFGLTLLQLMGLLTFAGIAFEIINRWLFA